METPWYVVIAILIVAVIVVRIYGLRQENNGWNTAKKKYYGKLMIKEALYTGMHYAVVATTYEEELGAWAGLIIIINGKRNPEDEDAGLFAVKIPLQGISDNDKLPIKAGDTIAKTMEGKIIIVPP